MMGAHRLQCADRPSSGADRRAGAADAIAAVEFAPDHDLLVSIKGGGHGVAARRFVMAA
jgi:hypothetical protein